MTATSIGKPLTYTEHQVVKGIVRHEVYQALKKPGTWRQGKDGYSHVVTSTMRSLITRGLVVPDESFTGERRGARLTQAGYTALSRATRRPPKKKGS